jgi:uncharacterized membrane protein
MVEQVETVAGTASVREGDARASTSRRLTWLRALPWLMALGFAAVYTTISVARFERLATRSFDLGIFEQAIRHYAHLQAPIVDLEGAGHNFLGDHWNPAIAVYAPFYRLFPSPLTLLVVQALLIALAVVPITRAGILHLGRWSGIAVGLAFGMSYGIQSAVDFDVHEVSVAAPLLAFAMEAFLAGRWRSVAAWAAPLVLVKEDLGLTVAGIGLVLMLVGARRWGLALAAFGAASFGLTMMVLIPHFNAAGTTGFSRLTPPGTGASLLQRLLHLPSDVLSSAPKLTTVLLLLVVTAFLALRSPLLILVVPTLGWRLLSSNPNYWGQSFHYDLVLMPIMFAALIDGMVRAQRGSWRPLPGYVRAAPAMALLVGLVLCARFPFGDLLRPSTYQASPRAAAAERVLSAIPDGSTVETDLGLISRLTQRTRVFWIGNAAPVVPQFVVIDHAGRNPPLADPVRYVDSLHPGSRYVLVHDVGGYALMRRVP